MRRQGKTHDALIWAAEKLKDNQSVFFAAIDKDGAMAIQQVFAINFGLQTTHKPQFKKANDGLYSVAGYLFEFSDIDPLEGI